MHLPHQQMLYEKIPQTDWHLADQPKIHERNMMMQIQQLKYFVEVTKTLNITEAAKNLYISQPSLSQQIKNLEKELGVPLLIRQSKSVRLTEAGEQFGIHAKRILGGVDQLSELMQRHSLLQEGTLRIGMLWVGGYLNLFKVLTDYQQQYPGMHYDLKVDGSNILKEMILNHSLHGAFIIDAENQLKNQQDLYYHKIAEDAYAAVLSANHPLAQKKYISIEDLQGEDIVMPHKASAFRQELDLLFHQAGFAPHIVCETSQPDIVMQLASHNFGIGFSTLTIANKLKSADVAIVPLEHSMIRTIYYVTLKELLDYPSIEAFTKYIENYTFS